jgi:hypothetical protein
MWIRRVLVTLLAASVVGFSLVGAPAVQAATDPKLKVTDVAISRTAVAVSGLNTVPVQIRVRGGYDSTDPADANLTLVAFLERTGGTGPLTLMISTTLLRVSGTTPDGVWAGPVNVPSTANGTFKVSGVRTGPFLPGGGSMIDPTPFNGPTLAVAGFHLPKFSAKVTPKVVPFGSGFSITWAVADSATGKPYGTRLRVLLAVDADCLEGGGQPFLTSTAGLVTKAYPASAADTFQCLRIPGNPISIAGIALTVARPGIVSAVPSRASAPVGTVVPVNGNVLGPPVGCLVHLQRLMGATQWRTVSSGSVRASGRFTVTAQPAYKGLIPYRVYFPTCHRYQAGLSRTFYIRGL